MSWLHGVSLLVVKLRGMAFKADALLAESWPGAQRWFFLFALMLSSVALLSFWTLGIHPFFLCWLRGALFSVVLFFKCSHDNESETFKSLFPVLCRTPCGSEWLLPQLPHANATPVADFSALPSLTRTLSQARLCKKEEIEIRKESNSIKVKELSFHAHSSSLGHTFHYTCYTDWE